MAAKRPWKDIGRYGTVGIELVISVLLGFYGGRWLDQRYGGGKGWLTLLGIAFGAYAGFRQLFIAAKVMQREFDRQDRAEAAARREMAETAARDLALREESGKTADHEGDHDDGERRERGTDGGQSGRSR